MKLKKLLLKLINEQLHLRENISAQKHNFEIISKQMWSDAGGMIYDSIFGSADAFASFDGAEDEEYEEEKANKIHELFNNVSALKNFKIVDAVTGRSFGKIFKLENGHILKLFSSSLNVKDDLQWYEENYEKAFTGTANKNTLPIYDYGSFDPGDGAEIHYVEMAELFPLDKWIVHTKRGSEYEARRGVSQLMLGYEELRDSEGELAKCEKDEVIRKVLRNMAEGGLSFQPYTLEEAESIVGAFWENEQGGRRLSDVAARNMGMVRQSDPNSPIIIIFDR